MWPLAGEVGTWTPVSPTLAFVVSQALFPS